jgi:Tfp pilus assembly PilM family ATPase
MSDTKLYLGIEVGDVSLKVALLDAAEKRVLKTAVLQTETSPIDDIFTFETVLQGWMEENGLEDVEAISVTVPAFRSIVRQICVPAEAVANIDDYVQWYLGLITNGDKDSYILDYKVLSGDASVGETVLLIAVRREWAEALRKGFRSKSLVPKSMEVDVLSLMNLMDVADGINQVECVIKADYFGVTMLWLSKDNLHALRCVSTLSLVNASMEEAAEILANGICEQMKLAKEQNSVPEVKQVNICGEMAMEPLFVQKLREKLTDSCQLILMDSFSNLRLPVNEADSAAVLNCAGAIGTALSVMEGV